MPKKRTVTVLDQYFERVSAAPARYERKRCRAIFSVSSAYRHQDCASAAQPNVAVQDQIAAPAQANAEAEPEGAYAADVHGGSDVEDPSDVEAPDHVLHAPAHVPGGAPLGIHGDVQAQLEHGDLDAEDELDAYAQDAPLEDELDPADVELDAWHQELDATDEEIATARSSTNAQAAKAAAWRDAADERICDLLEDTPSVRRVAFQHLEDLYHGVPLNVVEKHIRDWRRQFWGRFESAEPTQSTSAQPADLPSRARCQQPR